MEYGFGYLLGLALIGFFIWYFVRMGKQDAQYLKDRREEKRQRRQR